MTILEAIKSTVAGYPLSDNTFLRVLTDRGLTSGDTYTGKSQAFELATADVYMTLVSATNITEGGFSVSLTDKSNFREMANAIYQKYADNASLNPKLRSMTQRW
jgi:hypothetical protein